MRTPDVLDTPLPERPGDPRNRTELAAWLEDRAKWTSEPLNAREYLMVQRLQSTRKAYSEM